MKNLNEEVTIEVSMIVKNESEILEKALKSVEGADFITIVDTGSTDNTVEIAKRYTNRVYTDYKWEDSFCKARNYALSKAKGKFILVVDADEQLLTPISKVKEIINNTDKEVLGVITKSEKGVERNISPRLFKNKQDIYWKGDIHNHLSKLAQENVDVVIQYGYSPAHKKDPDRALRIAKKAVKENPALIRERYYLAREYWYRKQYKKCITEINKYLKVANWRPEIADAYLMKARCLWGLHKGEEARVACMYAIMTNPDFKEALLLMSEMNYEPRKSKWLLYSKLADNEDVLFVRT